MLHELRYINTLTLNGTMVVDDGDGHEYTTTSFLTTPMTMTYYHENEDEDETKCHIE